MLMERTGVVRDLSQIQAQIAKLKPQPRLGQERVFKSLVVHDHKMSIQLPTGYGKTYTALGVYSILKTLREVNRLLVVFPTDAQLEQFDQQTPSKWKSYAIDGSKQVTDIRAFKHVSIKRHRKSESQIFAITVQSLLGSNGNFIVSELMADPLSTWMVVVDEYHHYGIDKPFGTVVSELRPKFLLCMSATPFRPGADNAFGEPNVVVSYREAVEEHAVKPLVGHAYHYKIEVVDGEGRLETLTTQQIIERAGGSSPAAIEKLSLDRKMRWSPQYISPLVITPIERMITQRIKTGYKLQAVIGAMCVSHAQLVCEQVRFCFPDLVVEWVGTGEDGRTPDENRGIISRFAPASGEPTVDVLVHVGMAGEGLDTVNVSEVVHLNAAGVNNANNQENGRAARYLPGVTGHINFDACSEFARKGYVGSAIMAAMDNRPPQPDPDEDEILCGGPQGEWQTLPDDPCIRIVDIECTSIDSGDEEVKAIAEHFLPMLEECNGVTFEEMKLDSSHPAWEYALTVVKEVRRREIVQLNDKSILSQWRSHLNLSLSVVTSHMAKLACDDDASANQKELRGRVKKAINTRKKNECGAVMDDVEVLAKHCKWLKRLDDTLKETRKVPSWCV